MLRESKGNMYSWVTHQWNTIKGKCYHDCSYCYMKQWGELKPIRFDYKELTTDLGSNNIIFVNDSNDMFADKIPEIWIQDTLNHCIKFNNKYLLQTKNPRRIFDSFNIPSGYYNPNKNSGFIICTTIETNRWYPQYMNNSPEPYLRATAMNALSKIYNNYVTIEPLMDFDLEPLVELIKMCNPLQVNIGADSKKHNLPEPPKEKILELIGELKKFTVIDQKRNLSRLLK